MRTLQLAHWLGKVCIAYNTLLNLYLLFGVSNTPKANIALQLECYSLSLFLQCGHDATELL